eukprot:scaffold42163_cov23-Cyclotella_meneghiniana.AAC.2
MEYVWVDSRISQHLNQTIPMSHYKYNDWLGKVEIGKWALKWSMQGIFQLQGGGESWLGPYPLFNPRLSVY